MEALRCTTGHKPHAPLRENDLLLMQSKGPQGRLLSGRRARGVRGTQRGDENRPPGGAPNGCEAGPDGCIPGCGGPEPGPPMG